ncbi:MAG: O-antigen ligase family protein [Mariprofundaceae bacterium]
MTPARALRLAALSVAFLAPCWSPWLINFHEPAFWLTPLWFLMGLALWLALTGAGRLHLPESCPWLPLLLLPATVMGGLADPGGMLPAVSWWLALATVWLAGISMTGTQRAEACMAFVVACAVLAIIAWIAWLKPGDAALEVFGLALSSDRQGHINGPFANPNVLAGAMLAAWGGLAAWRSGNARRVSSVLADAAGILFAATAFATTSRSAWVVFAVLLALIAWRQGVRAALRPALWLLVGLALGLWLNQAGHPGAAGFAERFQQTAQHGLGERLGLWASALTAWWMQPLFGLGLGRFGAHYLDAQAVAHQLWPGLPPGLGLTTSAHNITLHLLAEAGLFGLAFALIVWWRLGRALLAGPADTWPAVCGAFALWLQGHVNITMSEPWPMLVFALVFGMIFRPSRRTLPFAPAALVLIAALPFAPMAWQTTKAWQAYDAWLHTRDAAVRKQAAATLLAHPSTRPFIVAETGARLYEAGQIQSLVRLSPWVEQAWQSLQIGRLLQLRFIIASEQGDHTRACALGKALIAQHWPGETPANRRAYRAACASVND